MVGPERPRADPRPPSALKHAAYSGMTLLPGEDPAAFEKLHDEIVAELAPVGRLEEHIVTSIARLIWRREKLTTYRLANQAQQRFSEICSELAPRVFDPFHEFEPDPEEVRAGQEAAKIQARNELGDTYELVEMGDAAQTDHLLKELNVVDRLEAMIDRCMKRLLFVRGVKSLSSAASPSPSPTKRLAAP